MATCFELYWAIRLLYINISWISFLRGPEDGLITDSRDIYINIYIYILELFSQRAWRWPNKERNMSPWQYTIFIVYKIKCCVTDWQVVFIYDNILSKYIHMVRLWCLYSNIFSSSQIFDCTSSGWLRWDRVLN